MMSTPLKDDLADVKAIGNAISEQVLKDFGRAHSPRVLTYSVAHALALFVINSLEQGCAERAVQSIADKLIENAQIYDQHGIVAFMVDANGAKH